MEAMLLSAAIATLSCADGAWILSGLADVKGMTQAEKSEIAIEILQVMPDTCSDEQYNPSGRK